MLGLYKFELISLVVYVMREENLSVYVFLAFAIV